MRVAHQPLRESSAYCTISHFIHVLMSRSNLNSAIVTIAIGPEQRLFAAHEDVLCKSSFFAHHCRQQFFESNGKRVDLPNESPEVFSAILEYLYKGDYTPKVEFDKKHNSWFLDDSTSSSGTSESIVYAADGTAILKDTVIYVSTLTSTIPPPSHILTMPTVFRPPVRAHRTPTSRPQETRSAIRRAMLHNPLLRTLRIRQHPSFRQQTPSSLPCTHHPQPQHLQAQRHHANGNGARRHVAVVRSIRRHVSDSSRSSSHDGRRHKTLKDSHRVNHLDDIANSRSPRTA